jgi:hypothetical protein
VLTNELIIRELRSLNAIVEAKSREHGSKFEADEEKQIAALYVPYKQAAKCRKQAAKQTRYYSPVIVR